MRTLANLTERLRITLRPSLREMTSRIAKILEVVYPTGTVRKWRTGPMIKTASGMWVPYAPGSKHVTSVAPDVSPEDPGAKGKLADAAKSGKLPKDVSPEEHFKIAEEVLEIQRATFPKTLETLKQLAVGDGTAVMGRVKDIHSAIGKLLRKPKYGTAENLMDGTGFRFVCNSVDDVLNTVKNIKSQYETSSKDEEDYITKPKDGYRSYHLIIKDGDGYYKEVQVRTPNQDTWANWCHDVYKPHTPVQAKAVEESKAEILAYGEKMSEFYFAKDQGKEPSETPDCPPVVKTTFGCMPTA